MVKAVNKKISLSVIAPILNEEFFLPLYLDAVSQFADEILLLDGGSQDNTIKIVRNYQKSYQGLRFWQIPQEGKPYEWAEGKRRNFLLNKAKGEWILILDIDEFISDKFLNFFNKMLLSNQKTQVYGFSFLSFWGGMSCVRKNVVGDPCWEGPVYRLIKKKGAGYENKGNHSQLLFYGKYPFLCETAKVVEDITIFHYHYALGKGFKTNDNRQDDYPEISVGEFKGRHPAVIRKYLGGETG
ncbi:glycosyltransferase [Halocella sp. SP3-1]|nr:glycosyltransferase [Halocella sp. SP3-1]MTI61416.1 glycosyltransferase [Bacillota bacterium]